MPVKKVGKKYEFKDKEYDTEAEANKVYMAYLDNAFGVKTEKPKKKKKSNEDTEDSEEPQHL